MQDYPDFASDPVVTPNAITATEELNSPVPNTISDLPSNDLHPMGVQPLAAVAKGTIKDMWWGIGVAVVLVVALIAGFLTRGFGLLGSNNAPAIVAETATEPTAEEVAVVDPYAPFTTLTGKITDAAGVLGVRTSEVQEALDHFTTLTGTNLFLVFADSFGSNTPKAWAARTASNAGLGADDVMIAFATDIGTFAVVAGEGSEIGPVDITAIENDIAEALAPDTPEASEPSVVDWATVSVDIIDKVEGKLPIPFPFPISALDVPQRYVPVAGITGTIMLSNLRIITSDADHPARDGWEWRIADLRTSFGELMSDYGFGISWISPLDFYHFSLESNTRSAGTHDTSTVYWQGAKYEIDDAQFDIYWWADAVNGVYDKMAVSVPDDGDWFDAFGTVSVQVPIGYDGVVIAFNNWETYLAHQDQESTPTTELLDGDTVFFQMK